MENYCARWSARATSCTSSWAGLVSGGTGSNGGTTKTIAGGKVAVPSQVWKVVIVLPSGRTTWRAWRPRQNHRGHHAEHAGHTHGRLEDLRVTVDQVETLTGYDFFSLVPASIQNVIESRVDNQ